MIFQQNLFPRFEIESVTTKHGRVYQTPDGEFPSVTTVLGWASDNSWKQRWYDRVGKDEAERITARAGVRGTIVHTMLEQYIVGDPQWKMAMPFHLQTFNRIRKVLDEHLTLVNGLEYPLWSKRLQTAGRVDLIGEWDDIPSIIDFKTAKNEPKKDTIDKYLYQATCYALMIEERLGINIPRIVVVIARDDLIVPTVLVGTVEDHRLAVETIFSDKNRPVLMGGAAREANGGGVQSSPLS